jgi:tRNA-dihydrouridine synthase
LAELVQRAKIPITGNGGVYNPSTARRMAETGVAAIMLGRAALANPWLFADVRSDEQSETLEAPSRRTALQNAAFSEHLSLLVEFSAQLARNFPNDHVPSSDGLVSIVSRTHLFRYFNGRPGAAVFRRRLNEIHSVSELLKVVRESFELCT